MPDKSDAEENIEIPPIPKETAGAVTGAVIGSMIGPVGTVVGGIAGAMAGKAASEGRLRPAAKRRWKKSASASLSQCVMKRSSRRWGFPSRRGFCFVCGSTSINMSTSARCGFTLASRRRSKGRGRRISTSAWRPGSSAPRNNRQRTSIIDAGCRRVAAASARLPAARRHCRCACFCRSRRLVSGLNRQIADRRL